MRNGFGLIQAIFFILAISFVGIIAIEYSKISIKTTTDTYLKEQADLFMQSATEFGILAILNQDRKNTGCLNHIKIISKDQRFFANINITDYMVRDINSTLTDKSYCDLVPNINTHDVNDTFDNRLNGSGIFYITVESNTSHPKIGIQNKIRLVKRVWQKF